MSDDRINKRSIAGQCHSKVGSDTDSLLLIREAIITDDEDQFDSAANLQLLNYLFLECHSCEAMRDVIISCNKAVCVLNPRAVQNSCS
jgi:hypothetical protein